MCVQPSVHYITAQKITVQYVTVQYNTVPYSTLLYLCSRLESIHRRVTRQNQQNFSQLSSNLQSPSHSYKLKLKKISKFKIKILVCQYQKANTRIKRNESSVLCAVCRVNVNSKEWVSIIKN